MKPSKADIVYSKPKIKNINTKTQKYWKKFNGSISVWENVTVLSLMLLALLVHWESFEEIIKIDSKVDGKSDVHDISVMSTISNRFNDAVQQCSIRIDSRIKCSATKSFR